LAHAQNPEAAHVPMMALRKLFATAMDHASSNMARVDLHVCNMAPGAPDDSICPLSLLVWDFPQWCLHRFSKHGNQAAVFLLSGLLDPDVRPQGLWLK
jgi:hypothetical protein